MKLYCYTGDVKKLVPNGWTFQKLYARNYKTYRKDGIIMYVVSKMCLEFDNIKSFHQPKVVEFILKNLEQPQSFWVSPSHIPIFNNNLFPSWVIQECKIIDRRHAVRNKAEWHLKWEKDNDIPYLEDGERIKFQWVQIIKELKRIGDIKLRSIN